MWLGPVVGEANPFARMVKADRKVFSMVFLSCLKFAFFELDDSDECAPKNIT
jgi:hypothetical protein